MRVNIMPESIEVRMSKTEKRSCDRVMSQLKFLAQYIDGFEWNDGLDELLSSFGEDGRLSISTTSNGDQEPED